MCRGPDVRPQPRRDWRMCRGGGDGGTSVSNLRASVRILELAFGLHHHSPRATPCCSLGGRAAEDDLRRVPLL